MENYTDRKTAALVGIYESSTQDQHVPYIVPVECGARKMSVIFMCPRMIAR